MKAMGEIYEIVIFTASLSKYADPVLDQLDIYKVVGEGARLFRESCYNNKGNYVKVSSPFPSFDLSPHLTRDDGLTGAIESLGMDA